MPGYLGVRHLFSVEEMERLARLDGVRPKAEARRVIGSVDE
jgi:hypothetical protein